MRNFFIFLRRFSNQILFGLLLFICLLLIGRTDTKQGNSVLNSANGLAGNLYEKQNNVVHYFSLQEVNDSLMNENARLQNQLMAYQSVDTLNISVKKDTIINHKDSTKKVTYAQYIYRSAIVINNSVMNENNYITLNRGSDHGIKPNMAVVSSSGIVGKVVRVSKNFSVVLSAFSEIQPISARLKDGTTGLIKWTRNRPTELQMRNVPKEVKVRINDTVETTNYSFFPEGVNIGRVKQVMKSKSTGNKVLLLEPATNFNNIKYVYVVENTYFNEKKSLEDSTKITP